MDPGLRGEKDFNLLLPAGCIFALATYVLAMTLGFLLAQFEKSYSLGRPIKNEA